MNRIINIPRLVLLLLTIVMGASSAWAQTTITKSVWDGTVPSTANVSKAECSKIGITGSGTEADPYVISTAGQFAYLASKMNGNTNWWKLKEKLELDLDGENHAWTYGQSNANFKGHFDGNGSTISNMKFETNGEKKSFGLFPQIQGNSATNHAEIKNLTLKNCQITTPGSGTSYGGTSLSPTNVGLLVGKINGNADIESVTITDGSIAYDVTTTGDNYVGALAGYVNSDNCTIKQCAVSATSVTTGTGVKKNFYLGGIAGNVSNNSILVGNTVSNLSITLDGNTNGNNIIGGLIGKVAGVNSTVATGYPMGKRSLVQKNTVEKLTITMNGSVEVANLEIGGLIGWVGNHSNVFNNKVTSPAISLTNNINNSSYIGGAVGYFDKQAFIDGMIVEGGSITGPSSDMMVKNNVVFFVGGFLGYQNSSAATNFDANKFKNVAVTGMNINLGHYVPAGPIQNHKFSVGGIVGSVNAPNMRADGTWGGMPENLIFKGGKIYAPWASTSPIVGNFNAGAATHQNMTLDQVTTVDAIEKAKANTWYYYDYKLGLSDDFLKSASVIAENAEPAHLKFRKNYNKATETIDDIEYLAIDNSTLTRANRYQDSERDLKTVLWWTQQASMDKSKGSVAAVTYFTANEQPIYPQSVATAAQAGNLTDYPYHMYFFQGVGHAKYLSKDDAANIVKGIEANFTNDVMPAVAVTGETILNVIVTNDGEKRRGFDNRTLSVVVMKDTTAVTSKYTYQWYVNGKADGTGSTKTLTPHWKDGQGVTVNVLSDSTIVATASYGFAPGVLHTKNSIEEPTEPEAKKEEIRSDFNKRGTSANPYVIDCESALRQLSYLSTAHTSIFWETLGKPASPYPTSQTQGHYDRAYYVLTNDIDLGNREFTPISHVGYGGDGSWGTYSTNWIFQGVFDGQGHKISNLKITWGASQYVGNNANLYYGLFGCVGNAAAARKWGDAEDGNTVIKNLIIDGATLTHNTSEKSFYYDESISTNANYCMVGVLAGIVSSNTTVQNIEIRGSKITDEGSSNYSLATQGLYVGGAIGAVQAAYNATTNVPTSTQIQHIAAQVDIKLEKPAIVNESNATQTGSFNVGGIIGRFVATGATKDQVEPILPSYTLFSGTVNAPKAWISPVVASLRYRDQQTFNFNNHSKHWEGNNKSDATQINIKNALFYDFYIGGEKITDTYPANSCGLGFRTIAAHFDGVDAATAYSAQKYQGVNYGAQYIDVVGSSLTLLNENAFEDIHWVWKDGFVHMSTDAYVEATISRVDNTLTAGLVGAAPVSFKWKASFDGETWIEIPSALESVYEAYPSLKLKYIVAYVNDGTQDYRTLVEKIEPNPDLISPAITEDGNTYSFNLNSTAPEGQMVTNYEWYETKDTPFSPAVVNTDLTLSDAQMEAHNGLALCKVVVTELGVVIYEDILIAGATVIYVNGDGYTGHNAGVGDDNNDGMTPQTPVKTIDKANSLLKKNGTWDTNIIVVMGILDSDYVFQSSGHNPTTLTGKWNGVDYEGIIRLSQIHPYGGEHTVNNANRPGKKGANCYVLHDTKFENLIFYGNKDGNCFIELHGHDAIFGKGLVMQNFANLSTNHGNFDGAQVIPEFTIILMATNIPEMDIQEYTRNRTKPQVVTFQSGHYGRIMAGRFTQAFFANADNTAHSILASAKDPVWAVFNIEIDKDNEMTDRLGQTYTCDINALIAGLTDGSMYGDLEINFHGGNVAYIVGSNQGNAVNNGNATYIPTGSTKSGSFGQWPNSSYFGRTVINVEQDPTVKNITVGNLYAGGLGREVQMGGSALAPVDMYLYGRTEVNVKSGTVGSVYGGGVGGVIGVNPWDAHVPYVSTDADNVDTAIMNKVQYGDTRQGNWSSLDASTAKMASVALRNYNKENGTYTTESLDLTASSTTINVSGGNINGSVYGGGYGYVPNMPEASVVQGVGSVFGTSNINIYGGNILGSVFGGSQGASNYFGVVNQYGQTISHVAEMNGTVNLKITGNEETWPTIGGDIYGGGQGIVSGYNETTKQDEEYLRIATAGNTDLGDKYKTDVNIFIDLPESHPFEGNIYGGGEMGAVDGKTNVVIKSGYFDGNVYGGGKGEEGHANKAKVTGSTNVEIGTKTINVPITSEELDPEAEGEVTITGSVFGGGQKAIVTGNTRVKVGDQD